jgi:hypothetical protein
MYMGGILDENGWASNGMPLAQNFSIPERREVPPHWLQKLQAN